MAPFLTFSCGFWPGMQRDIGCRPDEYFRSNRESDGMVAGVPSNPGTSPFSRISMQGDPKPKPALAAESGRLDELLDQHTTIEFDHAL